MSDDLTNVIQISEWAAGRKSKGPIDIPPAWLFDMRAFVGVHGYEAAILSFNDDGVAFPDAGPADRLRRYADCLDQLSWLLRQQAEHLEPSESGIPLATAVVFESSLVRVRINDDKVVSAEQFAWLDLCFDDAKAAARLKPAAPNHG